MKSKLAFGLAVCAGLTLTGIARADDSPANPVLSPAASAVVDAPAQLAATASPVVVDPTPTAAIRTPKAQPEADALSPATRSQAKVVTAPGHRNAYLHRHHRQKDAHHVALMLEHRTTAHLAREEAYHAAWAVPSVFLLGVGY